MNTIENSYVQTEQLIADALGLVQQLHRQVVQEADGLLGSSETGFLDRIAMEKQALVKQLEQFQEQLNLQLASQNLPGTDEGVQAYFQKAESAGLSVSQASGQWADIKLTAAKCRALNDQNGMTINLLILHTQRALQILKGQPTACLSYGRDGSSQQESYTQSLVSV